MIYTSRQVFSCFGCGAHPAGLLPFACPHSERLPSYDHVLRRRLDLSPDDRASAIESFDTAAGNPFVTFRWLSGSYHLARSRGWSDERYVDLVNRLDEAIEKLVGVGFRATPSRQFSELSAASGCSLWVKDETRNVGGSHKGRHLMGVMLWLLVLRDDRVLKSTLSISTGAGPSLAIASCGNAALAAGVVAAAGGMPLDVYIPINASRSVTERLAALGARLHVCRRQPGTLGDPCVREFRSAVAAGSLPFTCQGNENGLTVDGGETLAFELVAAMRRRQLGSLDRLVVQVGGGALASSLVQGLQRCRELDLLSDLPKICAVQTTGCHPLHDAWRKTVEGLAEADPSVTNEEIATLVNTSYSPDQLDQATKQFACRRNEFMQPWSEEPHSVAEGILDDETYDWLAIVNAMLKTGGFPVLVEDEAVVEANELARRTTGIPVGTTGSAGLAGCLQLRAGSDSLVDEQVEVLFTGVERDRS